MWQADPLTFRPSGKSSDESSHAFTVSKVREDNPGESVDYREVDDFAVEDPIVVRGRVGAENSDVMALNANKSDDSFDVVGGHLTIASAGLTPNGPEIRGAPLWGSRQASQPSIALKPDTGLAGSVEDPRSEAEGAQSSC